MITGTTRLAGVIGWPVDHSRSPRMHNAAFAALGLDWAYVPLPVAPERVGEAVAGLRALGFAGANVTVPHKQAVLPFLDELTAAACAVEAVNTIIVRPDNSLLGDNTDGAGFLADLAPHLARPDIGSDREPPLWRPGGDASLRTIVLGAGGAARAITHALLGADATVVVLNRTYQHGQDLVAAIKRALPDLREDSVRALEWVQLPEMAHWADLIVNCTSVGLRDGDPMPWDPAIPFRPDQIVYDAIYNRPTEMLDFARSCGAVAVNGLGMLVHQGARAFELWTGCPAPVDVMRAAIEG